MPAEKLSMKKVREILRLYSKGLSYRAISKSTGIGLGSVSEYIKRAKAVKLSWPLPEELNDEAFRQRLFIKEENEEAPGKKALDFKKIHEELKRKGVTLLLLWYEYKAVYPDGYSYSRYC